MTNTSTGPTRKVGISLKPETLTYLDEVADRRNQSRSAVVAELIEGMRRCQELERLREDYDLLLAEAGEVAEPANYAYRKKRWADEYADDEW
ncbi:MAG: hypothetical protein R3190_01215 [Thermoanaerobaculia bacterium]|nr:hypothetical protein [Thermoanaerobaculia bacterium]